MDFESMKKVFSLAVILGLVMAVVGCDDNKKKPETSASGVPSTAGMVSPPPLKAPPGQPPPPIPQAPGK